MSEIKNDFISIIINDDYEFYDEYYTKIGLITLKTMNEVQKNKNSD